MRFVISDLCLKIARESLKFRDAQIVSACVRMCVCLLQLTQISIKIPDAHTQTPLIVYTIMIRECSIELRKKLNLRQQIDEMCA